MFCQKCGKEIDDKATFCIYCGTPVGGAKDTKGTATVASESPAASTIPVKTKFWQKSWFSWLMVFLFWPVGLFLLWKNDVGGKKLRIALTLIVGLLGLAVFFGGSSSNNIAPAGSTAGTTQKAAPKAEKKPDVPMEYRNALVKAEMYGNTMHMSKQGIYNQLTSSYGEKFPAEAAKYAIENAKLDYKKQALEKAKLYQREMAMSKDAVYNQLVASQGENFTEEEAKYAIDNLPK